MEICLAFRTAFQEESNLLTCLLKYNVPIHSFIVVINHLQQKLLLWFPVQIIDDSPSLRCLGQKSSQLMALVYGTAHPKRFISVLTIIRLSPIQEFLCHVCHIPKVKWAWKMHQRNLFFNCLWILSIMIDLKSWCLYGTKLSAICMALWKNVTVKMTICIL
jgi:hypothetical protein